MQVFPRDQALTALWTACEPRSPGNSEDFMHNQGKETTPGGTRLLTTGKEGQWHFQLKKRSQQPGGSTATLAPGSEKLAPL